MNVDGAFSHTNMQAGCRGVCRNEVGEKVCAFMANIGHRERRSTFGGTVGLHGFKLAWDRGIRKWILETDSNVGGSERSRAIEMDL